LIVLGHRLDRAIGGDNLVGFGASALAGLRQMILGGNEMGEERRLAVVRRYLMPDGRGRERNQRTACRGMPGGLRRSAARRPPICREDAPLISPSRISLPVSIRDNTLLSAL
jgi:hypothetical protein